MYQDFAQLPESIFLLQGTESSFDQFLKEISITIPTVESLKQARFTKEDAQELVTFNLERTPGACCVVYFDVFMPDAAQVLLKTLEEPNEGIRLIFITPHPYLVPQTIRSRVRLVLGTLPKDEPEYVASKKSITEYIKDVIGNEDIEAAVRRAHAAHLLDALEYKLRDDPINLQTLYECKAMLFKANMPTKQIVEYLVAMVF